MTTRTQIMVILSLVAAGLMVLLAFQYMERNAPPQPPPREASVDDYEVREAVGGGKTVRVPALGIETWMGEPPGRSHGQFKKPFAVDTTDIGYRGPNGECVVIWFQRNDGDERDVWRVFDDLEKERRENLRATVESKSNVMLGELPGREVKYLARGRPSVVAMRERYYARDRTIFVVFALGEGVHGPGDVERCLLSFKLTKPK